MRRWLWSAAALAGLAASTAQGQYLVIRYYVGGQGETEKTPGGFGPGRPGGGPMGGLGSGGGLGGPGRPGGVGGPMGGPGGGGLAPAPGRPGGGQMGGGALGPGGGVGVGGGPMGGGALGAGGIGGPMGGGAFGPGGMGGGAKGPGGFGAGRGGGEELASSVTYEIGETFVIAAIEVDSLKAENLHVNEILHLSQFKHKWGMVAPFNDGWNIIVTKVDYKSPARQFQDKKRDAMAKKERSADDMAMIAEWALAHGLLKECTETLDELPKEIAKGTLSAGGERVKTVLAAYQKVKEELAKPVFGTTAVDIWKKRLPAGFGVASSNEGHYVCFFSEQSKDAPPEVTRRLAMLEEKMRAFYIWFAFRGKVLPMPEEKLVAIQVQDAASFRSQRLAADDVQPISDGFFAQRDNVAVFSTNRLDEPYQLFSKNLQQMWQKGWKRDDLLAGKDAPKELKKGKASEWKDEFKRCQTLALLDKALENEAEIAAVTHEGTRQLAIATGFYPRSVMAPEWIRFGFASLFDTPKGPYVGTTGTAQTAFWQTCGSANWAYTRPFLIWERSKDASAKLDEPAVALKRTITDYYFRNSRKEVDEEIDSKLTETEATQKKKEIARAKEEQLRARSQAWALTYFLAKYKTDDLLAYFQELSNQPRDLEMDEQTNLLAFGRAFKVINAAGDGLDDAKVDALAKEWFGKIKSEALPRDFKLDERKEKQPQQNNQGGPGGAPGPGGFGPPGGGGFGKPGAGGGAGRP